MSSSDSIHLLAANLVEIVRDDLPDRHSSGIVYAPHTLGPKMVTLTPSSICKMDVQTAQQSRFLSDVPMVHFPFRKEKSWFFFCKT